MRRLTTTTRCGRFANRAPRGAACWMRQNWFDMRPSRRPVTTRNRGRSECAQSRSRSFRITHGAACRRPGRQPFVQEFGLRRPEPRACRRHPRLLGGRHTLQPASAAGRRRHPRPPRLQDCSEDELNDRRHGKGAGMLLPPTGTRLVPQFELTNFTREERVLAAPEGWR